jgi:transcriptional regulator with XRE-family HTH domain
MSMAYLSDIENGRRAPAPRTLHRLAAELGVTVANVLEDGWCRGLHAARTGGHCPCEDCRTGSKRTAR